jgi:hypothetical protein
MSQYYFKANLTNDEIRIFLDAHKSSSNECLFKNQQKLAMHRFSPGQKVEVMYKNQYFMGTIVHLFDEFYFRVEIDILKVSICCNSTSQNILPLKFCDQNDLKLEVDSNNSGNNFDWDDYLSGEKLRLRKELKMNSWIAIDSTNFNSLTTRHVQNLCEKFKLGSYLECVNPFDASEILVGRIYRRVKHLLYIYILNLEIIWVYTVNSYDLYPLGWCEMNNYNRFVVPIEILKNREQFKINFDLRRDIDSIPYLTQFKGI